MEFLAKQATLFPHHASLYKNACSYYDNKLYHELTIVLNTIVSSSKSDQKDENGIALYEAVIAPIQSKINQLQLSMLCTKIAMQYKGNLHE